MFLQSWHVVLFILDYWSGVAILLSLRDPNDVDMSSWDPLVRFEEMNILYIHEINIYKILDVPMFHITNFYNFSK